MEKEENLPSNIAIFPLSNAIFFPGTILPLNIFENRYLQLVGDCMKEKRMFGMVQPKNRKGVSATLEKGRIEARFAVRAQARRIDNRRIWR